MRTALLLGVLFASLQACSDTTTGSDGGTSSCSPDCPRGTHQVGCNCEANCSGNQATIQFTNNLSSPMQASLLNGNSFVITTPTLQTGEQSQAYTFTVPNGSYEFHTGFRAPSTPNQQFPNQWQCSYPLEARACASYDIRCP